MFPLTFIVGTLRVAVFWMLAYAIGFSVAYKSTISKYSGITANSEFLRRRFKKVGKTSLKV